MKSWGAGSQAGTATLSRHVDIMTWKLEALAYETNQRAAALLISGHHRVVNMHGVVSSMHRCLNRVEDRGQR